MGPGRDRKRPDEQAVGRRVARFSFHRAWRCRGIRCEWGASSFDESGFIVMIDEDGKPVKKFASDLATMLIGARKSLRLVVLNCCESAKINVGDKFGNPAIGLMRTGWLPAVVAMQFPITDNAAIRMSSGFYSALANNRPA